MLDIIKDFLLQLALIATLVFTFQIFFAERFDRSRHVRIIQSFFFGISILLFMSFPTYVNSEIHLDMRNVPLLLGTLYGGLGTGVFLSAIIILYRFYLGVDLGFYTTTLTLLFSMPAIIFFQKLFMKVNKNKRIQIALILPIYYSLVGITSTSLIREFSFKFLQAALIHMMITVAVLAFFVYLNEMIKETLRKNQQLQAEAKEAEIAFLRSQIKPHFLYNALNSIAALCIGEPRKAEKLTLDLAQVLRSGFDFKQLETMTSLENELELVQAYLNIEKARFGARLSVEYDVDANLNIRIPPLILQPLVENAIRHGLVSNLRGGTLKISIKKKEADNAVSFTVEDNGCGMSFEKREEILKPASEKKGVGLRNICQRIQFHYGKGLCIESEEGKGTKVSFEIPV